MRSAPTQNDLPGLYVHVPFCSAICPYCDFAVRVADEGVRRDFVDELLHEADALGRRPPHEAIGALHAGDHGAFDTVYLGGGTPSLLAPDDLARLLDGLREALPIADDAALFFEANPEDVTTESLRRWQSLGVSMLSLGVQSFDDDALRFLGRRHDGRAARRAAERALDGEIETVSVDLIYGLPQQDRESLDRDLDVLVDLAPPHVSCYELEVHERTVFGKRRARGTLDELPEDDQAELFLRTHERLGAAGWEGYEVSNFARDPAHRSRHNAKYWRHVPYLGLGPSAHSYAPLEDPQYGVRWWNHRHQARWRRALAEDGSGIEDLETLDAHDHVVEALMLGLRTAEGVDLGRLRARWGVDLLADREPLLNAWAGDGLVALSDDASTLRPTLRGMAVADRLAAELTG